MFCKKKLRNEKLFVPVYRSMQKNTTMIQKSFIGATTSSNSGALFRLSRQMLLFFLYMYDKPTQIAFLGYFCLINKVFLCCSEKLIVWRYSLILSSHTIGAQ